MKFFIRAAAKSPRAAAMIIWVALKLHVIHGKELALVLAAMKGGAPL